MPWQQQVADVGSEYDPATGIPYYREVQVTVPRQSGKTTLVLAYEVQRALGWEIPTRVAYTAQTGFDARKKLIDDQAPLLMRSPLRATVRTVRRAAGQEGVLFTNGSRIEVMATSDAAGHGRTLDLGIIDEAFADTDARREQAILPAMATRPAGQLLIVSTAGTNESLYLQRKLEIGREAADTNRGSGVAYFEWSAADDTDIDDPATWWEFMPALGHTITPEVVEHARLTMSRGEFERAFCNRWTSADDRMIPAAVWDAACRPDANPTGQLVFGIDVNPERSAAAIVAVSESGVIEVIDHRPGLAWLPSRVDELNNKWRPRWTLDGSASAPIASLVGDFERLHLDLIRLSKAEYGAACARFHDAVMQGTVTVRSNASLDSAVAGVGRRTVGDSWYWTRRSLVDISPLVATTVAFWVASQAPAPPALYIY